jgi:hypothetical protein
MAPRQHSGSADPGAPRPEEFDHQKYDYRPAHPDRGFGGAILNGIGTVQDVVQRDQLEQGLSMRPAGHIPRTNADSYDHPQLKQMIDASQADQADELGQMWNTLGNEIMVFGANLQRTATSSEAIWVGQAGNAARGTLSGLAGWSNTTGQGVQYMGTTMRTQADAARTAKRTMPDPVDYSPADYQARLNSTMNPIEWVQIIGDARQQADKQQAAHAEAVRVTDHARLHATAAVRQRGHRCGRRVTHAWRRCRWRRWIRPDAGPRRDTRWQPRRRWWAHAGHSGHPSSRHPLSRAAAAWTRRERFATGADTGPSGHSAHSRHAGRTGLAGRAKWTGRWGRGGPGLRARGGDRRTRRRTGLRCPVRRWPRRKCRWRVRPARRGRPELGRT